MVISLPVDQEVPGSFPCSAVKFFSNGELSHDISGVGVSVLDCPVHVLSIVVFGGSGEALQLFP